LREFITVDHGMTVKIEDAGLTVGMAGVLDRPHFIPWNVLITALQGVKETIPVAEFPREAVAMTVHYLRELADGKEG